jgi:hypothetical protein
MYGNWNLKHHIRLKKQSYNENEKKSTKMPRLLERHPLRKDCPAKNLDRTHTTNAPWGAAPGDFLRAISYPDAINLSLRYPQELVRAGPRLE